MNKPVTLPHDFILDDDGDGPWTITVNGKSFQYGSKDISYNRICAIAGKTDYDREPDVIWSVGPNSIPIILNTTDIVRLDKNLVFDCDYTDNA